MVRNSQAAKARQSKNAAPAEPWKPETRWVKVTMTIPRTMKAELEAIAAQRSKGAWIGAVKYTDVLRDGAKQLIERERAAKPSAAPKRKAVRS